MFLFAHCKLHFVVITNHYVHKQCFGAISVRSGRYLNLETAFCINYARHVAVDHSVPKAGLDPNK